MGCSRPSSQPICSRTETSKACHLGFSSSAPAWRNSEVQSAMPRLGRPWPRKHRIRKQASDTCTKCQTAEMVLCSSAPPARSAKEARHEPKPSSLDQSRDPYRMRPCDGRRMSLHTTPSLRFAARAQGHALTLSSWATPANTAVRRTTSPCRGPAAQGVSPFIGFGASGFWNRARLNIQVPEAVRRGQAHCARCISSAQKAAGGTVTRSQVHSLEVWLFRPASACALRTLKDDVLRNDQHFWTLHPFQRCWVPTVGFEHVCRAQP